MFKDTKKKGIHEKKNVKSVTQKGLFSVYIVEGKFFPTPKNNKYIKR